MLSDEEREALEILELYFGENSALNITKYVNIVLNLIKKQQKEIEELNLENIELKQSKIVDKNSIPNQDNFYECYNFVSKDKIKAKIEVLKEDIQYSANPLSIDNSKFGIEVLQSLLEKE